MSFASPRAPIPPRVPVAVTFRLLAGDCTFGFALPDGHDCTLPLVIDPAFVLRYSTYLAIAGFCVGCFLYYQFKLNRYRLFGA
jgi:hypothetical protein